MKATVLVDNLACGNCEGEWGLAVLVETGGKKILLDTGHTGLFADNAKVLGIDLSDVNFGVLSHAHYDHANGMARFFIENGKAKFFLREGTKENCYFDTGDGMKYIGIHQGTLSTYGNRIVYVSGTYELLPGVWLVPHTFPHPETEGLKAKMFTEENGMYVVETFAHEQSLVCETEKGLVVFNSCCHGGADNIINEIRETFPGKTIAALVGGLHLFRSPEEEVRAFAGRVKATGIGTVVTGHCTGDSAMAILKDMLGSVVKEMHAGLEMEW